MGKSSIIYNFLKGPGFAPDLDRRTPNVIVDGVAIPTVHGFETTEGPVDLGYTALAATAIGAYCAEMLDGTFRLFAGTVGDLYEATSSAAWTNVTRTAGGTYVGQGKWNFAQLGNVTLASVGGTTMQASPSAGSKFADITGAPDATYVEVCGQFVFGARTTATADVIRWSALGDYTSWTPSVTTQAGKKRITSKPGSIIGIKTLGENLVIYKKNGIYVGRYVGAPDIWAFDEVPGEVGASSHAGVCNIGYAHYFMDRELSDVWMFDGSRPVRLNCPAIKWFVDSAGGKGNVVSTTPGQSYAIHNKAKDCVWFAGRSNVSGVTSYTVIGYNYKTNQWGYVYTTTNGIWFPYCSATDVDRVGFFSYNTLKFSAHTSQASPYSGGITTGDIGDGENVYCITGFRPLWKTKGSPSTTTLGTKMNADDTGYVGSTPTVDTLGAYHVLAGGMWHRLLFNWTGMGSLAGIQFFYDKDGTD